MSKVGNISKPRQYMQYIVLRANLNYQHLPTKITIVLQFHCRILTTYSSRNHLAGGLRAVSIVGSPSPCGMVMEPYRKATYGPSPLVMNQHLVGLYWIFRLSTLGYGINLLLFWVDKFVFWSMESHGNGPFLAGQIKPFATGKNTKLSL